MRTLTRLAPSLLLIATIGLGGASADHFSPYVVVDPYPHVVVPKGGSPSYFSPATGIEAAADAYSTIDASGVCRAGPQLGTYADNLYDWAITTYGGPDAPHPVAHVYDYDLKWQLTYKATGIPYGSASASATGSTSLNVNLVAAAQGTDLSGLFFEAQARVADRSVSPPDVIFVKVSLDGDTCEEQTLAPLANEPATCHFVYVPSVLPCLV